jgi:starvation-inducible outer membrane lipoprotein
MKFKVGDQVRYELCGFMKPRWFANRDYGGVGIWENGEVITVYENKITVISETNLSVWPLEGHPEYDPEQWSRPGFLQLVEGAQRLTAKCVCGCEAVYGKGCNLHADWCDLYRG